MKPQLWRVRLLSLSAYGDLLQTDLFQALDSLLQHSQEVQAGDPEDWSFTNFLREYSDIFRLLREDGYKGFGDYLWDYFRYQPTLYGKLLAEEGSDPALEHLARREVDFLLSWATQDCEEILNWIRPHISGDYQSILSDLPRWSSFCPFDFDTLTAFHKEEGYGIFAQYPCFVWRNDKLSPVKRAEIRCYKELHGYELQREQVYENTSRLMTGQSAQNILLFGEGGTGKSAVVKSMVQAFPKLRLIQAEHNSLRSLPTLMAELGKRKEKFILFIDDLAFDQDDNTYSALKSILEGGLRTPPKNVVIYATSNRRHLVRQTFAERAGEEVDMRETISEKTALSERFGLRIAYFTMKKDEFLSLVEFLLALSGKPPMAQEELHQKAMRWEIRHGGRSPRVAEQFIDSLEG